MGPNFDIATARVDGRLVITLRGDLDMATVPELEAAVSTAEHDGARELNIDLQGIEFIDSSGLRALLEARSMCDRTGLAFCVVRELPPAVTRVFDIAGITESELPFCDPEPAEERAEA